MTAEKPAALAGNTTSGPATPDRFASVEKALRDSADGEGIPGAAVALGHERTGTWTAYHGLADRERSRPWASTSRQRVTCLARVPIAQVALMLVDRGLITMDEPLGPHLPDAVRRRGGHTVDITLRNLLTHTSGIDDSCELWRDHASDDLAGYVRNLAEYPQIAEPGETFVYTDVDVAIVALLIERLTGGPWRRAVNQMLLEPLGIRPLPLDGSTVEAHYGDSVAKGYMWGEAVREFRSVPSDSPMMSGDSLDSNSLCFSLDELVTLARFALDDGVTPDGNRLLSAELARQMRTPQVRVAGHDLYHSWGLGWMLYDETSFGFDAAGPGYHSFIRVFPDRREVFVMLANAYPAFVLYYDTVRAVVGEAWPDTSTRPDLDVAACVGTYAADGFRLVVEPGAGRLVYRFLKRTGAEEWVESDSGYLVPAGTGGFSTSSTKKIRRGSLTPIWTGDVREPMFIRFGLRVVRRVA